MAVEQTSERMGAERRGSIGMVLLVAVLLIAAAAGLMFVGRDQAEPYVLAILAVLGMIGVFSLFATAAGILHVAGRDKASPMLGAVADGATDGILVTDPSGRVVYANAAYRALTDAVGTDDARPVERVFLGDPEVSEAIYRLVKAAREGRRLQEEVRVASPRGEPARWLRMRVRPLGDKGRETRTAVWTVADVTRDRDRHETAFLGLQHAIDYLDHAPAGFFSVDASGHIGYLNATLADWLGHDLAQIGSGGLRLTDIVPGESASLLTQFNGDPGEVKPDTLDLDLKTRDGRTLPVRLYHKVAFAADGAPGSSRTLVLNRARDDGTDPQRAAEVRFIRFFHNTPLAIAAVDKTGRIVRANALAARLFQGKAEGRSILNVVNAGDRGAIEAAIAKAARGKADIAPIDAALAGRRGREVAGGRQGEAAVEQPANAENQRWARFYVTPVGDAQGDDHEAAIVYALDTTEQRLLQHQFNRRRRSTRSASSPAAPRTRSTTCSTSSCWRPTFAHHPPADRSVVPGHHADQAHRDQRRRGGAAAARLRAQADHAHARDRPRRRIEQFAYMLRRTLGEKVTSTSARAISGQSRPTSTSSSRWSQPRGQCRPRHAGRRQADDQDRQRRRGGVAPVRLQGHAAGDYVMVEVTDTGTGISPEIMHKIFLPSFSTQETGEGTGLGLATVYGIVRRAGGFVYPESEVGKGTTFRIFLPRHLPSAEPQGAEEAPAIDGALAAAEHLAKVSAPAPAADDTGQGTILLVEDEKDLRILNARGLSSRGYTVLQAGNGVEAIDVLEQHDGEIDLVVSDVVMPEMDGPALLKELRRRKLIFVWATPGRCQQRAAGPAAFWPSRSSSRRWSPRSRRRWRRRLHTLRHARACRIHVFPPGRRNVDVKTSPAVTKKPDR